VPVAQQVLLFNGAVLMNEAATLASLNVGNK
jgi:hypothetical protein